MMVMVKGEEWFGWGLTYCWWEGDEDGWSRWEVWDRGETKMFVPSQCGANLDGNLEEAVAATQQQRRRCNLRQQTGVRATSTNRFLGRWLQESDMGLKVGGQRTEKNQEAQNIQRPKRPIHHQLMFFIPLYLNVNLSFFRWTIFARGEERPLNTRRLKTCLQVLGLGLIVSPLI